MGKDLLKEAKGRYARLMEAEAIMLDVYEVIGAPVKNITEYKKDLKTVLNLLAHYKHREVGTITNLINERSVVVEEVAPVAEVVEEPVALEVTDEVAEMLKDYEVVEVMESKTPDTKKKQPQSEWKGVPAEKAKLIFVQRRAKARK